MYDVKELFIPNTLEEALDIMAEHEGVRPLAGGTDIIVKMRSKCPKQVLLMALQNVEELYHFYEDEAGMHIGPMLSYTKIARNPVIAEKYPLLKTAALAMGGPQVQNLATIGGNVCNGATSADGAAPLMALEAQLVIRSKKSEKTVPITEFYLGPGRVILEPDELLVDIIIPPTPEDRYATSYVKFATRKAMDIATMGCAGTVALDADGTIGKGTLAFCTAGPCPVRCYDAEAYMKGKTLCDETLEEIATLALHSTNPRTSWRASKEYRENLIRQLSKRVLVEAYEQAGGTV